MKQQKKIKCRHCGTFFYPNPRNIKNQHYCSKPDCRKASKVASQQKWVLKNPDYFRSRENVARVQAWRKKHPGYIKSKSKKYSNEPLQDEIDLYTQRLLALGSDILLSSVSPQTGGHYEAKTSYLPGKSPPDTGTI